MKKINLAESDNLNKTELTTNHKIENKEELEELSKVYSTLNKAYQQLDELQFKYKNSDYSTWKNILRDLLNYDIQTSIQEYYEKNNK